MADRFPPSFLIVIVILTVAILIVSVAGIWEESPPIDPAELGSAGGEAPAGGEGAPEGDPPEDAPDARGVTPGTTENTESDIVPAPSSARIKVVWERLDQARPQARSKPGEAWTGTSLAPPALPEVRGRLQVSTSTPDGGVMEARVVSGSPLTLTAERVPDSITETVIEYRGRGLHPRIIELVTGSGVRVRRFLQPGGIGSPASRIVITAPAPLEGSVTGAEGSPVGGASVRIGSTIVTTDASGRFRMVGVRGQRVLIHVTAPRHAPHREIVELPQGFGSEHAPPFSPVIRLRPGVRLEVRVRFPTSFQHRGPGFRFYLVPFGHRIAMDTLAVESLGPISTHGADPLVVPGFPVGQEMCLVGVHPRMDLLYRRLTAGEADLRVDLAARPRTEVNGTVVSRGEGRAVTDFRLDTPLDTLSVGEYLVARRQIPGGHEAGNFPLPVLAAPVLEHSVDGEGGFQLTFDSGLRREVRLRLRAEGLRTEVVPAAAVHPRLVVQMGEAAGSEDRGASIELVVRLAGKPTVESFTCEGLEPVARPVVEPGRVRAVIGGVPLGRYRIRVEAPGFAAYTRTMNFTAATTRKISVFLPVR